MAITIVDSFLSQDKTASSTVLVVAAPVTVQVDDILLVFTAFDNLTATTPIVNSITKQGGTIAEQTWTQIDSFNSPQATAAAGVRGAIWKCKIGESGTYGFQYNLSAAVLARAGTWILIRGGDYAAITGDAMNSPGGSGQFSATAGQLLIA